MAERRMFTQKITESDAFLDMPLSTQALYFHLCMNAENKGLINNAYAICRSLCCDRKCVDELIKLKYLNVEKDGYLSIVHWYENNGIGETHKRRNNYRYREWRISVIQRDKMCVNCGSTDKLEAHHIKKFSEYPECALDIDNGITLCNKCHKELHQRERNKNN